MEPATVESSAHSFAEARRILSNCWIYTPERGLRAVTMHGNGSSLAVDGRRLQRWMIVDEDVPGAIVAYLYSSDRPSAELRAEVAQLAHTRFLSDQGEAFLRRVPRSREPASFPCDQSSRNPDR